MIIRRLNAKVSDQTLPCPALFALRDKYRKLAIRTWDRFEKEFATSSRKMRRRMLGFQSRRDYYIYAAETVGALTGLGDALLAESVQEVRSGPSNCASPNANSVTEVESTTQLTQIQPTSDESQSPIKIDSGFQSAAVATEEK